MKISGQPGIALDPLGSRKTLTRANGDFMDVLKQALGEVNSLQQQADVAGMQLMTDEIDFHTAMIMAEKANLALQLTVNIRNKVVEAYQEIMRMQV